MNRLGRVAMYVGITVAIVGGMSDCFLGDSEDEQLGSARAGLIRPNAQPETANAALPAGIPVAVGHAWS